MNPMGNSSQAIQASIIQTDKRQIHACLTEGIRNEINHLLDHYPQASGASIDALKIVQNHYGWVSDDAINALAIHMQLPVSDLESVATFYNLIFRKPVGKILLHPCNGISCMLMGYRDFFGAIQQSLNISDGETTQNNHFTLISLPCLGACDKAPVMLKTGSGQEDKLFTNLQPSMVDHIIAELEQKKNKPRQGGDIK